MASSPLSKMPKPQMPPHSSGTPSSEGKAMGRGSMPSAREALLLTAAEAFQQKLILAVPLQNSAISSPATMEGSAVRTPSLTRSTSSWRPLMFSSLSAV